MSNPAPITTHLNRGGRQKGIPNKLNGTIKDMVLTALDKVGGAEYLARQAEENPAAFLGLVGRILPTQLANADGSNIPWVVALPAEANSVDDWFRMYAPKHIQEARLLEQQQAQTIEGEADAESQDNPT